jgi:hypothetical protein
MEDTSLRTKLNIRLETIAMGLNLKGKNILEVGIAGDEKPSGSYKFFGQGNKWTTADIERRWNPDIVCDITDSKIPDNEYDLVIMTQALEHIYEYKKALSELYRITKEYLVIDCPWMFPFHRDKVRPVNDWKDWDDYWRFSPTAMWKLLKGAGFKDVEVIFENEFTLCLARK